MSRLRGKAADGMRPKALYAEQKRLQQLKNVKQKVQLLKQARNVKNILTLVGAVTALSLVGLIWSFLQWNIQAIWTVFALPGKEFIGLPMWAAALMMFVDVILVVIVLVLVFIILAIAAPADFACTVLPFVETESWYKSLLLWFAKGVCTAAGSGYEWTASS